MSKAVARRFIAEVKLAALARVERGESPTAVAAELGIDRSLLYSWRKAFEAGRLDRADRVRSVTEASARAAARAWDAQALTALATIMNDGEVSVTSRIAAANAILDRVRGKPRPAPEAKAAGKPAITRFERVLVDPKD
jgi:transposase-like protein